MALVLKPKTSPKPAEAPQAEAPSHQPAQQASAPASTAQQAKPAAAKPSGLGFLKKGDAAKHAMAQEDKKAEERKNAGDKLHRFWLPEGKDGSITFLDGDLTEDILDIPFLYEHNVYMNGHWRNWFICTQDTEPCPICEGGGKPYYAGFLTVIDHSEWKDKTGNVHRDEVKMFVAKRDTIKQLLKLSAKRGGLRGCRFDVSRTGDKSPSVGNVFDFTEKLTEQQLVQQYGDKAKVLDYNTILQETYMEAKELRKLGFGSLAAPIGGEGSLDDGSHDFSKNM